VVAVVMMMMQMAMIVANGYDAGNHECCKLMLMMWCR
jgi:hypothetical protein